MQSAMPQTAYFSMEDMSSLPLGGADCTQPAGTQRTNPVLTGLITPPESPIRHALGDGAPSMAGQSMNIMPSEESQKACLYSRGGTAKSTFQGRGGVGQPAFVDLNSFSDDIYAIIEQAVEQKMADAMGPLRLNINRLENSVRLQESLGSRLNRENVDLQDQNDTLSRQIDLHYRTIEHHTNEFNSHVSALNTMIETQAKNIQSTTENLTIAAGMIGHLSQVVTNFPLAINQVVHNAVQQQAQMAMRDVLDAQRQAMLSLSGIPHSRQSLCSSDEDARPLTLNLCHRGLDLEPVSSIQHDNGQGRHASCSTPFKSKGSFRYTLGRLFGCSRGRRSRP